MNEKKTYKSNADTQLENLQHEIEMLQAKADRMKADARVQYLEQMDVLRDKRAKVQQKLNKLEAAGEDAWQDLKTSVEEALDELTQAVSATSTQHQ